MMRNTFLDNETEALLLVNATNAFNCLKRQACLHNIKCLSPPLATVLIDTYRDDVQLYIECETLLSREGTMQSDPLAIAMYAIGILPLINQLKSNHSLQTMRHLLEDLFRFMNGGASSMNLVLLMANSKKT